MTRTLTLEPELEERVMEAATAQGLAVDTYLVRLIAENAPKSDRAAKFTALLKSWMEEEDNGEQAETFEYLSKVIDEDRWSDRPHFPPELRGITW